MAAPFHVPVADRVASHFSSIALRRRPMSTPTTPMVRVSAGLLPPSPEASSPTPNSHPYVLTLVAHSRSWPLQTTSIIASVARVDFQALSDHRNCWAQRSSTSVSAQHKPHPQPRLCWPSPQDRPSGSPCLQYHVRPKPSPQTSLSSPPRATCQTNTSA